MTEMREKIDEDHPVLAAILQVRHRNACNFAPSHSGSLGEARDDTLLEIYREVKAALLSQSSPSGGVETPSNQSLQEGMVLVPREPTHAMQRAYFDSIDKHMKRVETDPCFGRWDNHRIAYRAMLAASPSSISQEQEKGNV